MHAPCQLFLDLQAHGFRLLRVLKLTILQNDANLVWIYQDLGFSIARFHLILNRLHASLFIWVRLSERRCLLGHVECASRPVHSILLLVYYALVFLPSFARRIAIIGVLSTGAHNVIIRPV